MFAGRFYRNRFYCKSISSIGLTLFSCADQSDCDKGSCQRHRTPTEHKWNHVWSSELQKSGCHANDKLSIRVVGIYRCF